MTQCSYRLATVADRKLLSTFRCATTQFAYDLEVENHIQFGLWNWAERSREVGDDPRILLLHRANPADVIGVAAHAHSELQAGKREIPARSIHVLGLRTDAQGHVDIDGTRFSSALISAAVEDARNTEPDARLYAIVHRENHRSLKLFERAGMSRHLASDDPAYVLVLE